MNVIDERSWMYNKWNNGKFSLRLTKGLEEFLDFAKRNSLTFEIRCCKKCENYFYKNQMK